MKKLAIVSLIFGLSLPACLQAMEEGAAQASVSLPQDLIKKIEAGNKAAVDQAIRANPALLKARGLQHNTPLFYAVMNNKPEMVKSLINLGANVADENKFGQTPLQRAIYSINNELAHKSEGSENNVKQLFEIAELLINKNPAVINGQDNKQLSVLHFAVMQKLPKVVEFLLAKGANPNLQDKFKQTPLHTALQRLQRNSNDIIGLAEEIQRFKNDKKLDRQNKKILENYLKQQALLPQIQKDWIKIVNELVTHGSDVDIQDRFKKTAREMYNQLSEDIKSQIKLPGKSARN